MVKYNQIKCLLNVAGVLSLLFLLPSCSTPVIDQTPAADIGLNIDVVQKALISGGAVIVMSAKAHVAWANKRYFFYFNKNEFGLSESVGGPINSAENTFSYTAGYSEHLSTLKNNALFFTKSQEYKFLVVNPGTYRLSPDNVSYRDVNFSPSFDSDLIKVHVDGGVGAVTVVPMEYVPEVWHTWSQCTSVYTQSGMCADYINYHITDQNAYNRETSDKNLQKNVSYLVPSIWNEHTMQFKVRAGEVILLDPVVFETDAFSVNGHDCERQTLKAGRYTVCSIAQYDVYRTPEDLGALRVQMKKDQWPDNIVESVKQAELKATGSPLISKDGGRIKYTFK